MLRFLTGGESHGKALVAILEGMVAGLEVKPEDIIDNAGMEVAFDKDQQAYMLNQSIELAPKEARTIIIRVTRTASTNTL